MWVCVCDHLTIVTNALRLKLVLVLRPTKCVDDDVGVDNLSSFTAPRGFGESLATNHLWGEREEHTVSRKGVAQELSRVVS